MHQATTGHSGGSRIDQIQFDSCITGSASDDHCGAGRDNRHIWIGKRCATHHHGDRIRDIAWCRGRRVEVHLSVASPQRAAGSRCVVQLESRQVAADCDRDRIPVTQRSDARDRNDLLSYDWLRINRFDRCSQREREFLNLIDAILERLTGIVRQRRSAASDNFDAIKVVVQRLSESQDDLVGVFGDCQIARQNRRVSTRELQQSPVLHSADHSRTAAQYDRRVDQGTCHRIQSVDKPLSGRRSGRVLVQNDFDSISDNGYSRHRANSAQVQAIQLHRNLVAVQARKVRRDLDTQVAAGSQVTHNRCGTGSAKHQVLTWSAGNVQRRIAAQQ